MNKIFIKKDDSFIFYLYINKYVHFNIDIIYFCLLLLLMKKYIYIYISIYIKDDIYNNIIICRMFSLSFQILNKNK